MRPSHRLVRPVAAALVALALPLSLVAAELPAKVLEAFDRYERATEERMSTAHAAGAFLWVDGLRDADRGRVYARLNRGDIVTESLRTESEGRRLDVPDAIFLHNIAAVFVPGATVDQVQAVFQDYDRHAELFGPIVRRSRILEQEGDEYLVFRQLRHRAIITHVYNMDLRVVYSRPTPEQMQCRSRATRGAQVVDAGEPTERERAVQGDPANQWRLNTYCRAEQRPGGTYVEYETLFVAPRLPWMVKFLAGRIIRGFPAKAATQTLEATRQLLQTSAAPESGSSFD